MSDALRTLENRLGYVFRDRDLLVRALSHRSSSNDNNERLEFLGDSVLNFVIAEALFEQFASAREGQLSRLRASLVKGTTLAELAREVQIGEFLLLGTGEMRSGGHRRESILADALEAVIGAILLDADFQTCRTLLRKWFAERLTALSLRDTQKDFKTRLQEYLQARQLTLPVYEVRKIEGEPHAQTFHVQCRIEPLESPTLGVGSSRRIAEQAAAEKALERIGAEGA